MLISESVLSPTHFLLNSQRNFSLLLHIPLQTQACLTYFLLVLFSRMLLLVSYIFPELHFQRQTLQFPLFLGTIWVSCQDEINFPSLLSLCFREKIIFYPRVYCTIYHRLLYCSHLCVFISCTTLNPFLRGQNNILSICLSQFLPTVMSGIWVG